MERKKNGLAFDVGVVHGIEQELAQMIPGELFSLGPDGRLYVDNPWWYVEDNVSLHWATDATEAEAYVVGGTLDNKGRYYERMSKLSTLWGDAERLNLGELASRAVMLGYMIGGRESNPFDAFKQAIEHVGDMA